MSSSHRRLRDPQFQVVNMRGAGTWRWTVTYNGSYGTSDFGHQSFDMDGTDDVASIGDVGNVRTVAFLVKPDTTTEQLIRIDTGKTITVSGGTITYTGVTGTSTYVDGEASTTLVAGKWQHVVCVLSATVDANLFAVGTDGTNYGAAEFDRVCAWNVALTGNEVRALFDMDRM